MKKVVKVAENAEICHPDQELYCHYYPLFFRPMTIAEAFAPLKDPRQAGKIEHHLIDILMLTICGLVSGAQRYTDIVEMSAHRVEWFRTELGLALPNGIPSHDQWH